MNRLRCLLAIFAAALVASFAGPGEAEQRRVNILLVTVDDMNWNSVGAFGNPIVDITPNIDRLAAEGRRFERAYVAASNCSPSRVALQTGLYPQQSGARGFYYVDDRSAPTIAGELRRNGFLTGVINKTADTNLSPGNAGNWDYQPALGGIEKYSASAFGESTAAFFERAGKAEKPFYLVVNIADPHKPNFNDPQATAAGADRHAPSRIIGPSEVSVPGFLPDLPGIRRDVRNYMNSVKRADDIVGAIMASLRESGLEEDTLVIFLSDHGMPFPFAKSSVYDNGLRTPMVMKWPSAIQPDSIEQNIVSAVDIMPTILAAAGLQMPDGRTYFGKSLLAADNLHDQKYAFGSFDENARGYPVPMRGVISREWGYAFNAWADGEHAIRVDDMNHASFKQMERAAPKNPEAKARLDAFTARPVEELCHLAVDPDCLVNLAREPAHANVLAEMQDALRAHMIRTDDYLLQAFDVRHDRRQLQAFMRGQHEAAMKRAKRLQWKRADNIAGRTGANKGLFRLENQ